VGRDGSAGAPSLGVALFVALAVLSVIAFAVTRAARSADDLVNTVVLDKTVAAGGTANVRFTLAEPDSAVTVMIIDGRTDAGVRDLAKRADLEAGPQELSWDGTNDAGKPAKPGLYAIRVILGEQGRDILPPGRIRVLASTPGADAKGGKS
jgi:flagellar hook assembly protein FlgD